MEDAATAEITRVQLWQWVHYNTRLSDTGELVTIGYVDRLIDRLAPGLGRIVGWGCWDCERVFEGSD
jgi:malate synthase